MNELRDVSSNYLVSIIVASYNNEQYLRECLESCIAQTYRPLEVIVADDCSTDNSRSILTEYAQRYPEVIRPIFNSCNLGIAANRHNAITKCHGVYLCALDSDDMFASEKKIAREMQVILDHLIKGKDAAAFSNVLVAFNDGRIISSKDRKNILEGNIFESVFFHESFIPRDYLYKKDFYFQSGGYDLTLPTNEDYDLNLKVAKLCEFYYTGFDGIVYRRHFSGLSAWPLKKRIANLWKVYRNNSGNLDVGISPRIAKRKYKFYLKKICNNYFKKTKKNNSASLRIMISYMGLINAFRYVGFVKLFTYWRLKRTELSRS